MTDTEFNPEAKDGDGDGIVQEGTPFERSVEEVEINPVAEEVVVAEEPVVEAPVVEEAPVVQEAVITAPEPVEEAPAIVPVANNVIGSGKTKKKAEKVEAPAKTDEVEKVAVFAARNIVWNGLGKLVKGYNIISKEASVKWLTLNTVREATPEEIKARLG